MEVTVSGKTGSNEGQTGRRSGGSGRYRNAGGSDRGSNERSPSSGRCRVHIRNVQINRRNAGNVLRGHSIWNITVNRSAKLIEELGRLPGIGAKSAQTACISYHQHAEGTGGKPGRSDAWMPAKNVRYCKTCCTLTDQEQCPICQQRGAGSQDHHGGGDTERSDSL